MASGLTTAGSIPSPGAQPDVLSGKKIALVGDADFCEQWRGAVEASGLVVVEGRDPSSIRGADVALVRMDLPEYPGFEKISVPTIVVGENAGGVPGMQPHRPQNGIVLSCGEAEAGCLLPILRLLLERQQLARENEEYCRELESLNSGLHEIFADKAREVSILKDQLAAMFMAVPDVLTATTIGGKLERAAAALTTENFFRGCLILYEDSEAGWTVVAAGDGSQEESAHAEYARLAALQGEDRSTVVIENGENRHKQLLLTLRNRDGQPVGIVKLSASSETFPAQRESLALVELFLDDVMQSIEHFQLERHLEQSEASYRLLIDNVSDVIFRLDDAGKFTFVSRRVQEILGLTWKQILGRRFWEFLHPADADGARRKFAQLIAGESTTQDLRLQRPDGREVIAHVSVDPIVERGTVTGALGVARDVTEKRTLELQISESEHKYRRLTENAYDAIFLIEATTSEIADINPRAEDLTGYTRDELLGRPWPCLSSPDGRDLVRARMDEVLNAGVGRYEDVPLVRKGGTVIDVETAASVLELAGRKYFQAIVRDVSEHKRMTAQLHQRVMELQILAEVSDALQSSIDLDSVMGIVLAGVTAGAGLGFNRAFILSYDSSAQLLRGEAGVGPGSAEEAGRIWRELSEQGLSLAEILRRKALAVTTEDDTAARLARELTIRLDEQHEVFSTVILSREAMVVRAEGNGADLPPPFFEKYHAQEFALVPLSTQSEVIGIMLVDNVVTGARIEEQDLHRLKLFANSATSAIERGRLLQSLEKRLHELMLANRELKESRDRLVKTERLSAIGEVAASVAHEIRNPLVAIGGFARSVYQSLPEEDRNKSKVKVIVEETDRLEGILSGLLEFSRPTVPRFTDLDINSLILQTVHFMDTEIDHDLVHVTYDLDPELPRVWADTQQMRQVLLNLVRNAIQAMANGGTITLRTVVDQGEVLLSVEDTGPGIPADQSGRIFDAFFTTKSTGSGLGLSICAQIVRNHNGRIFADADRSKGAKLVISLPMAQKSA